MQPGQFSKTVCEGFDIEFELEVIEVLPDGGTLVRLRNTTVVGSTAAKNVLMGVAHEHCGEIQDIIVGRRIIIDLPGINDASAASEVLRIFYAGLDTKLDDADELTIKALRWPADFNPWAVSSATGAHDFRDS